VWLEWRAHATLVAHYRLAGSTTPAPPATRVTTQQRDRFSEHQVADATNERTGLLLLIFVADVMVVDVTVEVLMVVVLLLLLLRLWWR